MSTTVTHDQMKTHSVEDQCWDYTKSVWQRSSGVLVFRIPVRSSCLDLLLECYSAFNASCPTAVSSAPVSRFAPSYYNATSIKTVTNHIAGSSPEFHNGSFCGRQKPRRKHRRLSHALCKDLARISVTSGAGAMHDHNNPGFC